MSGWLSNGLSVLPFVTGKELSVVDVPQSGGAAPLTGALDFVRFATAANYYANFASKTTVAGTRYYTSIFIGAPGLSGDTDGVIVSAPISITGVNVLVGSVGGTDNWLVELHDANGNLLATSNTAGQTAGAAGTWQQFPFYSGSANAPVVVPPGQYFIVVQSNGTTAHPAVYNSPTSPLITGSATGTFGTGANFTPATTYTAGLGPVAFLYQ